MISGARRIGVFAAAAATVAVAIRLPLAQSQTPSRGTANLPIAPYEEVKPWGPVPAHAPDGGFDWEPARVATDAKGRVYVLRRSDPPIFVLDASGKVLKTFGDTLFVWAHGMSVDRDGNIWATDGASGPSASSQPQLQPKNQAAIAAGHGFQVYRFSSDGKLTLTLGKGGQAGSGPDQFNAPADAIVARDGTVFIADGHEGVQAPGRVLKYTKDGRFIKTIGGVRGKGPGEFSVPHALAFDSQGRLFVADRGNRRIQIFDLDGNFLNQYTELGDPSGIAITSDDTIFVTDTAKRIVYVGNAKTGKMTGIIPDVWAEGIAADDHGGVYIGEVFRHNWRKFSRKK